MINRYCQFVQSAAPHTLILRDPLLFCRAFGLTLLVSEANWIVAPSIGTLKSPRLIRDRNFGIDLAGVREGSAGTATPRVACLVHKRALTKDRPGKESRLILVSARESSKRMPACIIEISCRPEKIPKPGLEVVSGRCPNQPCPLSFLYLTSPS